MKGDAYGITNHVGTEHLTSALTALLANSKILVPK